MARPRKDSSKQPTEEALLDAASRVFGTAGFSAARLEDIAERAGITRASLLYHFGSKEQLYAATVARAFLAMERTLSAALSKPGTFAQRLTRLVSALEGFERDNLALLSVVLRGCLRDDDRVARQELERSLSPMVDRIEQAVRGGAGLPAGFPVRAAILQLIFSHLVHSAMGPLGAALWQGEAHTLALAKHLFGITARSKETA